MTKPPENPLPASLNYDVVDLFNACAGSKIQLFKRFSIRIADLIKYQYCGGQEDTTL